MDGRGHGMMMRQDRAVRSHPDKSGGCVLSRLHVFIEVGPEEHTQNSEKVYFEEKPQRKFYQD